MKLTTGISSNYVQGWDVVKALRELIQNNLDSREFEQALLDVAVGMMLRGGKKVKHN
jgi:hypothetical protein